MVARQELTIPPAVSRRQEGQQGLTKNAIRTILAGRADELLDLVTTNVARRILDSMTEPVVAHVSSCRAPDSPIVIPPISSRPGP